MCFNGGIDEFYIQIQSFQQVYCGFHYLRRRTFSRENGYQSAHGANTSSGIITFGMDSGVVFR